MLWAKRSLVVAWRLALKPPENLQSEAWERGSTRVPRHVSSAQRHRVAHCTKFSVESSACRSTSFVASSARSGGYPYPSQQAAHAAAAGLLAQTRARSSRALASS